MHHHDSEGKQPAVSEKRDAERLEALESSDPSLTPVLAQVVSSFMEQKPLPPD